MEFTDYYAESISNNITSNVGRRAKNVKIVSQRISPFKATGAVMALWGGVTGFINFRKYKKGKITKKQAITATASESVGMGLAAGLGLLADGILKTYILAAAAPSVLPFAIGVAVTTGAKITWDCKTKNNMLWCELKDSPKECIETASEIATA